jgi:hypothetical protein
MTAFRGRRAGVPVDVRVEWRSEHRHAETPIAVTVGGGRYDVEVTERWIEGPSVAGGLVVRCFVVRADTGVHYLLRQDSAGAITVALVQ